MLKKDKNFRISKQTKRTMATIVDPVERHAFKNMMIRLLDSRERSWTGGGKVIQDEEII